MILESEKLGVLGVDKTRMGALKKGFFSPLREILKILGPLFMGGFKNERANERGERERGVPGQQRAPPKR